MSLFGKLLSNLLRPAGRADRDAKRSASELCAAGAAMFREQRLEDAAHAFARALEHDRGCIAAHAGLGVVCQRLGQPGRALQHLLQLELDSSQRDLSLLAAQLLRKLDRPAEAVARLTALDKAHPGDPEIGYELGIALRDLGQHDAATAQFERLTAAHPDHAAGFAGLAALYRDAGRIDEAIFAFERVAQLRPDLASAASAPLFHEQYRAHDREALLHRHLAWARRFAPPSDRAPVLGNVADPDRRLGVGYVSADFNRSSAAQFIEALIEGHDRRLFRVVCYSASTRSDPVRTRLQSRADLWREIDGLGEERAYAQIREDGIDLLVDLNGHTRGGRLGVFARRAAPVQIAYLGYGATSGVAAMDYRITDGMVDPPADSARYYTEQLVRLPGCMWCFAPPAGAPPVNPLPALASGHVTFGSFNHVAKISPQTLAIWGQILASVPASRLVVSGVPPGDSRARVAGELGRNGVHASRLIFHERMLFDRYLTAHHDVDIALDPFPYTGGATTCNALWMGVPVLSLCGAPPLARSGLSLLGCVGLGEWVARSAPEYLGKALAFASDQTALASLRAVLRDRVARSPLCDAPSFVGHVEAAYRSLWRRWCDGRVSRLPHLSRG